MFACKHRSDPELLTINSDETDRREEQTRVDLACGWETRRFRRFMVPKNLYDRGKHRRRVCAGTETKGGPGGDETGTRGRRRRG